MKNPIRLTTTFGIVIRKKAFFERNIDQNRLKLEVFTISSPLEENDDLISYGPHFGGEVMEELGKRLSKIGLEYIDDFFYFHGDFPDWAEFSVALKPKE